jgi:hypothetical protein
MSEDFFLQLRNAECGCVMNIATLLPSANLTVVNQLLTAYVACCHEHTFEIKVSATDLKQQL